MNLKLIVSVALMGSVLVFLGIKPSDMTEQASRVWGKVSGDFMAIINGEAQDRIAKELRTDAEVNLQAICNAEPVAQLDESASIAHDINRDRCESFRNSDAIILNPEELKHRLGDRSRQLE